MQSDAAVLRGGQVRSQGRAWEEGPAAPGGATKRTLARAPPSQGLPFLGHILPGLAEGDPAQAVGGVHSLQGLVAGPGRYDAVCAWLRQVTHGVIPAGRLAVAALLGRVAAAGCAATAKEVGVLRLLLAVLLAAALVLGGLHQVVIHMQVTVVALHESNRHPSALSGRHGGTLHGKGALRRSPHHGGAFPCAVSQRSPPTPHRGVPGCHW